MRATGTAFGSDTATHPLSRLAPARPARSFGQDGRIPGMPSADEMPLGACTGAEEEAGSSIPTPSATAASLTPFEGCLLFSDEEAALIEDYVDAWNAHDVDAVMALFSEDAFTDPDEPNAAAQTRCWYEVAFDTGVNIRIDFDSCLGNFVGADGQDLSTGNLLTEDEARPGYTVCGAWCRWNFLFADDGKFSGVYLAAVDGALTHAGRMPAPRSRETGRWPA
jgi:hypothetical protein